MSNTKIDNCKCGNFTKEQALQTHLLLAGSRERQNRSPTPQGNKTCSREKFVEYIYISERKLSRWHGVLSCEHNLRFCPLSPLTKSPACHTHRFTVVIVSLCISTPPVPANQQMFNVLWKVIIRLSGEIWFHEHTVVSCRGKTCSSTIAKKWAYSGVYKKEAFVKSSASRIYLEVNGEPTD